MRTGKANRWWKKCAPKEVTSLRQGDVVCGDANDFLESLKEGVADIVFLDPPFNLGKHYGDYPSKADRLSDADYETRIRGILTRAVAVLKPGGSLYLYHIPRWAIRFAAHLNERLTFRHWIAISMKNGFARGDRLYPAHYALIHYSKGKPSTFYRPKIDPALCPHCGDYVKDYGGYRAFVDAGVNLTDVWDDLSPVRHRKYKHRGANELPFRIPQRVAEMSGCKNGLFVDPFAGSGTALLAARIAGMRFVGCDREPANYRLIVQRLQTHRRRTAKHVEE